MLRKVVDATVVCLDQLNSYGRSITLISTTAWSMRSGTIAIFSASFTTSV